MSNGRNCPVCAEDIGLWPIVYSSAPRKIKCPHCKSILAYDIKVGLLPFFPSGINRFRALGSFDRPDFRESG